MIFGPTLRPATLLILIASLLALPFSPQTFESFAKATPSPATSTEQAVDVDSLQGEYVPQSDASPRESNQAESIVKSAVQVAAIGDGEYQVVVFGGGLPGNGWDNQLPRILELATEEVLQLLDSQKLQKIERSSPTLNLPAPANAVVLFDGTADSVKKNWGAGAILNSDGSLAAGATSIATFRDYTLHLEFMIPLDSDAELGKRGDSGVFHQGRYETQIIDSFADMASNKSCGATYGFHQPDLNASFPPSAWQTYDIDFTAARWNADGSKRSEAKLTVRHNAILIQREVPLSAITNAAPLRESTTDGPLHLQDENGSVRFRNIWLVPRDADQESRRPRIIGFERFTNIGADQDQMASGGRLLMGELGCTNCHAAGKFADSIETKTAPILTNFGSRVHHDFAEKFLANPRQFHVGSTMPAILDRFDGEEKSNIISDLAALLATTGKAAERASDIQAKNRGEKLFHSVGCTQCHPAFKGKSGPASTSISLSHVAEKYTLNGLADFLSNPHRVRPSGQMPAILTEPTEAFDVAAYLLGDKLNEYVRPTIQYAVYRGSWQEMPDLNALTPEITGWTTDFDISVANSTELFAIRFTSYLWIDQAGKYTFALNSDDGSILSIDGEVVVNHDGIHPASREQNQIELAAGMHRLQLDYFEYQGEEALQVQWRKGRDQLEPLAPYLFASADDSPQVFLPNNSSIAGAEQVDRGKKFFAEIGCANCHQLAFESQNISPSLTAPSMEDWNLSRGCMAETPPASAPNYELTNHQRAAIVAACSAPSSTIAKSNNTADADQAPSTASHRIDRQMVRLNCYACHIRDDKGGPESQRRDLFGTSIPEMGDEGRLPPSLDGVGDKLKKSYLQKILHDGVIDRPYMTVRMPRFGMVGTKGLIEDFIEADQQTISSLPAATEPDIRVKATGRQLVSIKGLACVQCHRFGELPATGIQAIDLLKMPERVRDEWFYRYLLEPTKYRPGTRMPASFPGGKSVFADAYHGDAGLQIRAIWDYLADGGKAGVPEGLEKNIIELKPDDRPVIYRNFLVGLSPRGIAVGYPEAANLAWDAGQMRLAKIWHGRFIDASMHWVGRGQGKQSPLGDHIIDFENAAAIATLETAQSPWPKNTDGDAGYRFKGYQLDAKGRPSFTYSGNGFVAVDRLEPIARPDADAQFQRTLSVQITENDKAVMARLAFGKSIKTVGENIYEVDGLYRVTSTTEGLTVRRVDGQNELVVPLGISPGEYNVEYTISW